MNNWNKVCEKGQKLDITKLGYRKVDLSDKRDVDSFISLFEGIMGEGSLSLDKILENIRLNYLDINNFYIHKEAHLQRYKYHSLSWKFVYNFNGIVLILSVPTYPEDLFKELHQKMEAFISYFRDGELRGYLPFKYCPPRLWAILNDYFGEFIDEVDRKAYKE